MHDHEMPEPSPKRSWWWSRPRWLPTFTGAVRVAVSQSAPAGGYVMARRQRGPPSRTESPGPLKVDEQEVPSGQAAMHHTRHLV